MAQERIQNQTAQVIARQSAQWTLVDARRLLDALHQPEARTLVASLARHPQGQAGQELEALLGASLRQRGYLLADINRAARRVQAQAAQEGRSVGPPYRKQAGIYTLDHGLGERLHSLYAAV